MNQKRLEKSLQIIEAIKNDDLAQIRVFISSKDINLIDQLGYSALHHCAIHGNVEIFELLIRSGLNIRAKTKMNKTLLHLTCQHGHLNLLRMIFKHKANSLVNERDILGMTCLHWSVEKSYDHMVDFLCKNSSIELNLLDNFNRKAIDIAKCNKNAKIINMLEKFTNKTNEFFNNTLNTLPKITIKSFAKSLSKSYSTIYVASDSDESNGDGKTSIDDHLRWLQSDSTTNYLLDDISSGRQLVLTEAGRLALELTNEQETDNDYLKRITNSFRNQYEEENDDESSASGTKKTKFS